MGSLIRERILGPIRVIHQKEVTVHLIAWLVLFMTTMAPVTRPQFFPDAKETPAEATERYNSIASDISTVIWRNPPLFKGADGHAKTAAVVMSIMLYESGFRRDVDYGLGTAGRGDAGRSWCLMQIQTGKGRTSAWNHTKGRFAFPADPPGEVSQGWTGQELVQDRKKCIEAGYRIMRVSFASCSNLPTSEWLRMYASGSCGGGSMESKHRMMTGINWFNRNRPVAAAPATQGSTVLASSP